MKDKNKQKIQHDYVNYQPQPQAYIINLIYPFLFLFGNNNWCSSWIRVNWLKRTITYIRKGNIYGRYPSTSNK